jgi:hypothetical protein
VLGLFEAYQGELEPAQKEFQNTGQNLMKSELVLTGDKLAERNGSDGSLIGSELAASGRWVLRPSI